MIEACGSQLRFAVVSTPEGFVTRPAGLDFGAVMQMGAALGADLPMLADVLPRIESAIVNPSEPVEEGSDDDD